MNLTEVVAPATVITIAMGIMQAVKYADSANVFKRFYPVASLIIGLLLGFLFHFSLVVNLLTAVGVAGTYDSVAYSLLGKGPSSQ